MDEKLHNAPMIRFWRLMKIMLMISLIAAAGAVAIMHTLGITLYFHMVIAMCLGIILSLLLAGALMGLVFFSNSSGHDATVIDPMSAGDSDIEDDR